MKWLSDAGLIAQAHRVTNAKLPLAAFKEEDSYKIYFLDTGLLGAKLRLSQKTIVKGNDLFQMFSGAFTENFVAQELLAGGQDDLYYWSSRNEAEVDFIVPQADSIYPLEVKAGVNSKAKSLRVYADKFHPLVLSTASLRNLRKDGDHCNFPLYAVTRFPSLVTPSPEEAKQLNLGLSET